MHYLASLATPALGALKVRHHRPSAPPSQLMRLSRSASAAFAVCCVSTAGAQQPYTAPLAQERLSDWLLKQPDTGRRDLLGLSWRPAAEIPAQQAQKMRLVEALQGVSPSLAGFVERLPATGRVPVIKADARWLQANPAADPVLQPGDIVSLPARQTWVAVLLPSGLLCMVRHEPETASRSYLQACGVAEQSDWVWLIQPDGNVTQYGVQNWNRKEQTPPAPGAWLWAPDRHLPLTESHSAELAAFLATQGPAPGAADKQVLQYQYLSAGERADGLLSLPVTTNDWGVVGLWQTPTARQHPAGAATFSFSRSDAYSNLTLQLQPFDWLSGAFRYTDVQYQRYGAQALSGDQSYKDKSIDAKIRLWSEDHWLPQVAVGWRDLLGTGLFSGEYLVANKRFGDLDFSLGMGWGYVGKRGDIGNPLGHLSDRFNQRPTSTAATGGQFNAKAYFRGPAALFGGVQFHTPWRDLILKAEYEGNDYRHEPFGTTLPARTPINAGLVWRYKPWLDVSAAYERGNTLVVALSASTQLDGLHTPKYLDPQPRPISSKRPIQGSSAADTARAIEQQTDLRIAAIEQSNHTLTAIATNPYLGYVPPIADRALAELHSHAPADVDNLALRFEQRGTTLGEIKVDRESWVKNKTQLLPEHQRPAPLALQDAPPPDASLRREAPPQGTFSYGIGLSYRQNLGGPDAFLLYQLAADARAELRLRPDTWLTGTYRFALLDNYERYKYTAPSNLPRVRTLLREYFVTSRDTIPNLQLTHMGQPASSHFYLAYAGLLESMYAGAGVEYLYRPVNSRVAVGFDANKVQQREFNQKFGLRSYKVQTGHLTGYWDTGLADMVLKASVGQYLAGDRGVTMDVSKVFQNGVTIGAYATKTNVSAAQFGEGSFDKGVYLSIPFDALLPKSGPSSAVIVYSPLLRDGGAKLAKRYNLFDLTNLRDPRALSTGPAP